MIAPSDIVPILSQRSNWTRLGDRFSGEHLTFQTEDLIGVLVLVGLAIGLMATLRVLAKWQDTINRPSTPRQLFAELATAHSLSRSERAEVRSVATSASLADPSDVFVRPDLADRFADRALAQRLYG